MDYSRECTTRKNATRELAFGNSQFARSLPGVIRIATVFLGLLLPCPAPLFADADEGEAVTAGAKALDSWWNYPWYDDENDSVRRIELKARQKATTQRNTGASTSSWGLEWLGWTLIAIVVLAILVMMWRAYGNRNRKAGGSATAGLIGSAARVDRVEELPFQLEQHADDLLSAARRASDEGDYNRAIIFLYSHQLLELDKRDAIRLTQGKTNRQYLRELRSQPHLIPLLGTSMIAFEDVFFGGHSLARERFEACWQTAMQLLATEEPREAA